MLHPDNNTQYLDVSGHKIDAKQFALFVQTGKYSFIPEMEAGHIKSIRLKKTENVINSGTPAPEFDATDINGKRYSLNNLWGKIIVINFWFTGCLPCVREIPELNNLREKYKDDTSIVFLAITYDRAQTVSHFISKKEFKFSQITDAQTIISQYDITSFPTSIIIDKSGNIAFILSSYDTSNATQLDGVITALK